MDTVTASETANQRLHHALSVPFSGTDIADVVHGAAVTAHGHGYTVTLAAPHRDAAHRIARLVLDEFGHDPASGDVTVAVEGDRTIDVRYRR